MGFVQQPLLATKTKQPAPLDAGCLNVLRRVKLLRQTNLNL